MKFIKYYLLLFLLAITAFTSCSGDVAGITAGDIDDGLSSNYLLKSLSIDAPSLYNEDDINATKLALNYEFNPTAWDYTLDVPYSIDIITITAERDHNWSAMYLGEISSSNELTDNDPSGPITLEIGENIISITVVAQDGQQLEYSLCVYRHTAAYADAALSELSIDGVSLAPVFDPDGSDRSFSASVNSDYIDLTAFARSSGEGATVELRVNNDEAGDWSEIPLAGGMNNIQVICTAGDGTTRETYTLNIFRQQETTTTDLVALSISGIEFNEPFDRGTTSYTVNVSASMNPIALTAQADSSSAGISVTLNGNPVADMGSMELTIGIMNTIVVTVTNGATTPTDYIINATCTQASSNANLRSLKVGIGTISSRPIHPGTFVRDATYHDPNSVKFTKTIYDYVTVIYGFSSMTVTAVVDDSTAANVVFTALRHDGTTDAVAAQSFTSGTATATINLDDGYVTDITITVTSAAETTQVYHLYAKLLNADEFYWGIYAPSMDYSKEERWTKPQPGTFNGTGLVSGTVKWVVTTAPVSTITLTNYNDGKLGFLYNDGGININGEHRADLDGILSKNGWDLTNNPPFLIRTAAAESVAELDYHLKIEGGDPVEADGSYTGIKYLSDEWHIQTFKENKPYPFTATYNWFEPWSDGQ